MADWLFKSGPGAYSIDNLAHDRRELWDGIRNYQARNFMMHHMAVGDRVLFYHSSCAQPGVVGEATVCAPAVVDPTQFDPDSKYFDARSRRDKPRWWCVSVAFVSKLAHPVTLNALRATPALANLRILQRGNRLSITPLAKQEYDIIITMSRH